ncbi:hypothetical protein [Micromonospora vulcania]|uniref:Uncharacterized protein n=1 Tax=Micromonospora vulcania TaxID=1441873 RepID=A0ABW1HA11_9ACTN
MQAVPLTHLVNMRESSAFRPEETLREDPERDVLLRLVDERLRVELVVTPFGMPRRYRRPPAVLLRRGEWVRWQINYRFVGSCGGDWSYRLDTLNLAYGPVPLGTFLGEPSRQVDERAFLR